MKAPLGRRTRPLQRRAGLAAAVLAAGLAAAALPADVAAPEKTPVVRTALANGAGLVLQREVSSRITVLEIIARGGQAADPAGREGLFYLLTRLAMELPDQDTARDFTVKAVHYTLAVRGDYAVIHLECLSDFFPVVAKAFAEIVADPLFTAVRIDRIKEFMAHQGRILEDDEVARGHLAQMESFFGPSGYGGPVFGSEASLADIKIKDLREAYGRALGPGNLILTAVSDLETEALRGLLEKLFGGRKAPSSGPPAGTPPPGPVASPREPRIREIAKDSGQALVSAAFLLPPASRRVQALASIVETALGRGPGSRLWGLRAEGRLAYNVAAQATLLRGGGLLEAYLETEPPKRGEARAALEGALGKLHAEGLSAEELETTKTVIKSQFLRSNETKDSRASTLGAFEALGLGADFFSTFETELDAVTLEEANAFIRAHLDPALTSWVLIGPGA